MKNKLLYILLAFALTSCVSKGKFNTLKKQHNETVNQKGDLENVLARMARANDSLKTRITLLDSLLISEKLKNGFGTVPAPLAESGSAKAKVTISKTVEYDTKAVYICNIPNYVFWPGEFKSEKFMIGIIGDSKLNAALGAQLYEKKVQRMPAVVEPYSPGKRYHMIFFSESKQNEFYKLKKELQNQPVLLIAESPALEKAGAHIYVYAEGDKVKFRVNRKQIEKTGLQVSETLVKLGLSTQ
ncbi:MAG: YfiR family protein [Bacteroidia bacterium]